jgi:hypothetical protein
MICQNGTPIEHVSLAHCVASTNCGWPINRPFEIVAANGVNPHGNRTSRPGLIRDVSIEDFDILTDGRILLLASAPHRVEDIRLRDIRLRYALLDDPTAWAQRASAETDDLAGYHRAKAAVVAQNIKNLTLRDFSITWPEYPVPEDWHLLKTEWRRTISREIYEGNEDRIRRGEMRPTFKAFWGRRLAGGSVDLRGLTDSAGGAPDEVAGSTCAVLR